MTKEGTALTVPVSLLENVRTRAADRDTFAEARRTPANHPARGRIIFVETIPFSDASTQLFYRGKTEGRFATKTMIAFGRKNARARENKIMTSHAAALGFLSDVRRGALNGPARLAWSLGGFARVFLSLFARMEANARRMTVRELFRIAYQRPSTQRSTPRRSGIPGRLHDATVVLLFVTLGLAHLFG